MAVPLVSVAQPVSSIVTKTIDPSNAGPQCAADTECGNWVKFRAKHPSPYQAIAVRLEHGQAVVILSEPAPSLSRDQLAATLQGVFGDQMISIARYRMPTGVDGWLEDVVLRVRTDDDPDVPVISGDTLQPWMVPGGLVDRLRFVGNALFGTTDGFWLDDISSPAATAPIDELRVAPSTIGALLADAAPSWRSLAPAGQIATSASLKTLKEPGAYVRPDGVVALVVPQHVRLREVEVPFRRFAVASDLLFGAVRPANGPMILLGRTRRLPLSQLPPMRFETFASLAQNRDDELAQSYERQRIFAGRIMSGDKAEWDWAPILLSAQLDDSEFGTLLNQADQLLKSWSQHGDVRYFSFNYPQPATYPFEEEAASQYFTRKYRTNSLVFNWNTDDFATLIQFPQQQTLGVDRTNALPVLYIPAGEDTDLAAGIDPLASEVPIAASEKAARDDALVKADAARNYFAMLGSPVVVQVARNVLLAQATRSMLTLGDPALPVRKARSDRTAEILQQEARSWVARLLSDNDLPPPAQAKLADLRKTRTPEQIAEMIAMPQAAERVAERAWRRAQRAVDGMEDVSKDGQALEDELAPLIVSYRDLDAQVETLVTRWIKLCKDLHGTRSKAPGGGEHCLVANGGDQFDNINNQAGAVARLRDGVTTKIDAIHDRGNALLTRATALRATAREQNALYRSTVSALNQIGAIRPVFESMSGAADLDTIHQRVLAAVDQPVSGAIRTPSIVLSQSRLMHEMVGGHNITLKPVLGKVISGGGRRKVSQIADGTTLVEVPAAEVDQVGKLAKTRHANTQALAPTPITPGGESLLATMRAARSTPDETALLIEAGRCPQCDAIFLRHEGKIFMVRMRTVPPKVEQVFGKSGMIGAIGGPPRLKMVDFGDLPPSVVNDVTTAAVAPRAAAGGGGWGGRIVDPAPPGPERAPRIYIVERDGRPTMLKIKSSHRDPLAGVIDFKGAKADIADAAAWSAKFGGAAPQGTRILVDFGPSSTNRKWLGLSISAPPIDGLGARLLARVRAWLGSRPAALPTPEALAGLKEEIESDPVGIVSLTYYLNRGADVVPIAEVTGRPDHAG